VSELLGIVLSALRVRLLWPALILLAAFVIFFEFIADVGGSAAPLPSPPVHAVPTSPLPTAMPTEVAP
jgi:hypothetical protein